VLTLELHKLYIYILLGTILTAGDYYMLGETYKRNIAIIREQDPNAVFIDVTRTSNSPLSPSWSLLNDYKHKKITWNEYVSRFKKEMGNREILDELRDIAIQSTKKGASGKEINVYLVCYENSKECHRFILLDMIADLAKKEKIPVEFIKTKK
jgi:uncharacterized protein YeaO (DUF488 family)